MRPIPLPLPLPLLRGALPFLLAACAAQPNRPTPTAASVPAPAPLLVVEPTEPREQTADQQVQQVLNRLGFGARPGDVARVRALGRGPVDRPPARPPTASTTAPRRPCSLPMKGCVSRPASW